MQVEICSKNYHLAVNKISLEDNIPIKIDESIKRIIENEGFIKYKINKRKICTNGGNYLSELYEIDVKGTVEAGDKEINLFIKNIVNPENFKMLSVLDAYKTELYVYKELHKIFKDLQDDVNVPLEERYRTIKIYEGTNEDKIIMENIAKKGFTTYYRMDVVSLKFLELSIVSLARFHGLSFVLKEKRPEYFNKKLKSLNNLYIFGKDYQEFIQNISELTMKNVDEDLKEKVEKLYKHLEEKLCDYVSDDTIKTCLCHGDYRPNNIMMKVEDGEVCEIMPIDYQLSHYGCPVFDFLYLIYICTDIEIRKAHMSNLKDLYFNTLQKFLKYFDLDIQTVYPRSEFERVYKEKLDYGLIIALQFLPFMFASGDHVPDVSQELNQQISFPLDSSFKERLRGVLEEFTEWGYI